MNTADFDYALPPHLIAQHPPARRDQSRLLVVHRKEQRLEHRRFTDLPDYLNHGDLLVLNDTRVLPARLFGRKPTGGRVELLFLEEIQPGIWDVLLHASRRPKPGEEFDLVEGQARAIFLAEGEQGRAQVQVMSEGSIPKLLEKWGQPPLPPYIKRSHDGRDSARKDRERYQTVYARLPGAVAAPTAGLHFTPAIFQALDGRGVSRAFVTLHVGLGTFRPVSAERVEDHPMESERYEIPAETARVIHSAPGRIVAVGTTTVRTLEAVAAEHGQVVTGAGRTRLFIYPPYSFRVVHALLTNFHLPRSTLLMMVCAFAARPDSPQTGREFMLEVYAEAVRAQYRFYSYGDCMLIL